MKENTMTATPLKRFIEQCKELTEAYEREQENKRLETLGFKVETKLIKRTNTVRYDASKNSIELRMRNDNIGSALIERELTDGEGFKRRYNDDGIAVLIKDWDGSREMLDAITQMLDDTEAIDDREEKKLYIQSLADSTPKRVVYPLTAAQEKSRTRKPTAEELEELERIEMLADDYEFGYEAPVKKETKTTKTTVTIIKKEELNTPEDFLRALANLKSMFA